MLLNQSDPLQSRVYFELVDTSGDAVTGQTFNTTELQTSINGAAFAANAGSYAEVGDGVYYYQPAAAEIGTPGALLVKVVKSVYPVIIDAQYVNAWDRAHIPHGTTDPNSMRCYLPIYGSSGALVTGLGNSGGANFTAGTYQVSVNGAAFANGKGSVKEVGGGVYYYQLDPSEITTLGFVVVRFAVGSNKVATQRFYVFPYPHVVSWSPVPGVINVNPVTARWTPIVAVVEVADGEVPYFGIKIGNLWWDVYDGHDEAFSLLFAAKSSITSLGQNQYQFSILPNGGWWRSTIDMRARTGLEVD
jgi:hypothetical protein